MKNWMIQYNIHGSAQCTETHQFFYFWSNPLNCYITSTNLTLTSQENVQNLYEWRTYILAANLFVKQNSDRYFSEEMELRIEKRCNQIKERKAITFFCHCQCEIVSTKVMYRWGLHFREQVKINLAYLSHSDFPYIFHRYVQNNLIEIKQF